MAKWEDVTHYGRPGLTFPVPASQTRKVTLVDMLREKRAALGLTQAEAAQRIGVSRQTYETWESRTDLVPRLGHVAGIADFLEVAHGVVLGASGAVSALVQLESRVKILEERLTSAGL